MILNSCYYFIKSEFHNSPKNILSSEKRSSQSFKKPIVLSSLKMFVATDQSQIWSCSSLFFLGGKKSGKCKICFRQQTIIKNGYSDMSRNNI